MDGYQLIASLVDSLTWPAAVSALVVFVVLLFRKELARLMPRARVKYKELSIEFRLDEAEKDVATLPPPKGQEIVIQPTPAEQDRFEKLAELAPHSAMVEVRADVEAALGSLARAAELDTPKVRSMLGVTRLLRSRGVIGDEEAALLEDIRVIGNMAAHSSEQDVLTSADALRFRRLADSLILRLRVAEMSL